MNQFFYIVFAVAVIFATTQFVYHHFISKREPSISRFEKSLRRFGFTTAFYVVLIFVSYIYLPSFYTGIIPVAGQSTDVVVQELVNNQQRLNRELRDFRDILSFVLLLSGAYALGALNLLQAWRSEKKSRESVNTRPLGLELD